MVRACPFPVSGSSRATASPRISRDWFARRTVNGLAGWPWERDWGRRLGPDVTLLPPPLLSSLLLSSSTASYVAGVVPEGARLEKGPDQVRGSRSPPPAGLRCNTFRNAPRRRGGVTIMFFVTGETLSQQRILRFSGLTKTSAGDAWCRRVSWLINTEEQRIKSTFDKAVWAVGYFDILGGVGVWKSQSPKKFMLQVGKAQILNFWLLLFLCSCTFVYEACKRLDIAFTIVPRTATMSRHSSCSGGSDSIEKVFRRQT